MRLYRLCLHLKDLGSRTCNVQYALYAVSAAGYIIWQNLNGSHRPMLMLMLMLMRTSYVCVV